MIASNASALTESIISTLEGAGLQVYPHTSEVPDGAPMPCVLLNIEDDVLLEHVGTEARRTRAYLMTAVFRRGATENDLNVHAKKIMTALGFGKLKYERPVKGMHTDDQSIEYEFANKGNNLTTVTLVVSFDYVENYER